MTEPTREEVQAAEDREASEKFAERRSVEEALYLVKDRVSPDRCAVARLVVWLTERALKEDSR